MLSAYNLRGEVINIEPTKIILIEVGREIVLPAELQGYPVQRISAVRNVDVREFPVLARQIASAIETTPPDEEIVVIPSGPLTVMILWAMKVGLYRRITVGQWNGAEYDFINIHPSIARDFFSVGGARTAPSTD